MHGRLPTKNGYIADGLFLLTFISLYGLGLFYRGWKGETCDLLGVLTAPRWVLFTCGFLCQVPLVGLLISLRHQGYFGEPPR